MWWLSVKTLILCGLQPLPPNTTKIININKIDKLGSIYASPNALFRVYYCGAVALVAVGGSRGKGMIPQQNVDKC